MTRRLQIPAAGPFFRIYNLPEGHRGGVKLSRSPAGFAFSAGIHGWAFALGYFRRSH